MKTISYLCLFCALLSLLGCGSLVKEVNPDNLPIAIVKPVIHCFISPQDTMIVVYVQAPRAVIGTQLVDNSNGFSTIYAIPNAIVDLSDGTKTVRLLAAGGAYPTHYGVEASKFPIVAGRTYTLTIASPYFSTVTAQCTVPEAVSPSEMRVDSVTESPFNYPKTTYLSRLVWNDPTDRVNFYRVTARSLETYVENWPNEKGVYRDTSITSSFDLSFSKLALLTDVGHNGQQIISPSVERTVYSTLEKPLQSMFLILTLNNVDENYYHYHDAVNRQEDTKNNPFAEPLLIPGNIQGGLGCFGAFNQASLTVRVK